MQQILRIKPNKEIRYIRVHVFLLFFFPVTLIVSCAEVSEVMEKIPVLPDLGVSGSESLLNRLIEGEPPISTSIKDAIYEDTALDNFNPTIFSSLAEMPHTKEGGFFLLPGQFQFEAQSYCLEAGTYLPRSGGPGYIYAPLKGSKSEIVCRILERSFNYPEIKQHDIQVLLWAIIAKTKISDMSSEMIRTAAKLLTPAEIFELNGGALGIIPDEVFQRAIEDLPESVQRVIEAEQQLRQMLTQTTASTYEEIEEVAVLTGIEPFELLVREIPTSRWSKHPDGYYIRYFPSGYSQMRIELHVPPSALRAGNPHKKLPQFNPSRGGAIPGNTGSQRLGSSGRKASDADSPLEKARKATDWINTVGSILGPETIIPSVGVGEILNFNFDAWGNAIDALGGDPPRSDYNHYAKPKVIKVPPVQPGEELSEVRADAINSLLTISLRATSLLRACMLAQDRLGGALEADDMFWASEQAKVLCYYKRQAGIAMTSTADRFRRLIKICQQEGAEDVYINAQMIRGYQAKLRKEGFTPTALEAARVIGISAKELEKIRREHLAIVPEEIEGSYYEIADYMIVSLREGGAAWATLPEVDPYWER